MKIYSPSLNQFLAPEFEALYREAGTWPADAVTVSAAVFDAMMVARAEGKTVMPGRDGQPVALDEPPPAEVRIAALLRKVDEHLNAGAALRRYDSIITASLRAGYPGPFHDEGVVYATWMDDTYAKCYEILAQWEAGEIAEPNADELIAMLPVLVLPD